MTHTYRNENKNLAKHLVFRLYISVRREVELCLHFLPPYRIVVLNEHNENA